MGQAQRSGGRNISQSRAEEQRTKYIAERRRKQGNTGKRTGNTYKNSARDSISVISGSNSPNREGGGAQRSVKSGRENARRRGTGNDGLENLELWEISRKSDNPRLMRLADREQVPCAKRPSRPRQYSNRQSAGNPRPVSSINRRRAKRRKVYLYRIMAFLMIGVGLILIYQTTGAVFRMMHHEKAGKGRGIVEIVSEKIETKIISSRTSFPDPARNLRKSRVFLCTIRQIQAPRRSRTAAILPIWPRRRSGRQAHILSSATRVS